MEKYQFMSPEWIEMARAEITAALADKDLEGISFALCEEFTGPPDPDAPAAQPSQWNSA